MPKKVRESSLLRYALFNVKLSINSAVWETTHPIKGHIYVDILNENPAPKLGPNIRNRPTTQIFFLKLRSSINHMDMKGGRAWEGVSPSIKH